MPFDPRRALTVSLLGLLAAGPSGQAAAADWPQLGLDDGRGRASQEQSGPVFAPSWKASVSTGPIVATPAVADGYLVVAGANGELRGLRATDGAEVWRAQAAGALGASPAIDRGRVFVPTLSGQLMALRLSTGQTLWQRAFGGQNYGSPIVVRDSLGTGLLLAAGFPSQSIVRLNAATGAPEWQTAAVAGLVSSSPAVGAGQVLLGMNGGRYQSLSLLTGQTTWKTDVTGAVGLSAPLVVGPTSYFLPGGRTTQLHAADTVTGNLVAGWPVTVADPAAPAASTYTNSRRAVSSPSRLGALVVFVARFEYDLNANANGTEGLHLMREYVVAVNPAVPAVAWQQEVGRRDVQSINQVPELHLCPTPASFVGADGPLVAVASSLSARVRVFDQRGNEAWSGDLSAPTRSSPVFANGVLLVATDAGVIHGFASSVNHAPLAPLTGFDPAAGQMVESTIPELRWAPVQDESPSALTYQVRIDSDAEVLESWKTELVTDPGQPLATVPAGLLKAGGTYVYSVRSRDGLGALSEWSTPQSFIVALTPTIELGGQEYPTLQQAIAALPGGGGTINLGRGLLRLHAPLQLPAGASLVGVSPQDTILDATGVSAGVQLTAAGRAGTPELKNLTITGADVGVQVIDVEKASLRNLVVRDNKKVGIQVEEHAGAEAVNVTLARNGAGALAQGALAIRSSLVVQNDRGLARSGTGVVTSRYNDLVANRDGNYDDVEAGPGDIASAVTFRSTADFRPAGLQPSTDRGDPGDAFALEPLPNGGRVNMGAFGNTSVAELSASTHGWSGIGGPSEGSNGTGTTPPGGGGSGCSLGGAPRPRSGAWPLLALGAFIVARRRRWR